MTSVSVTLMAHSRRADWIPLLAGRLDHDDVQVAWDRFNDRHETGLRALRSYDAEATHHLVLQDDSIVCDDLIAGLTNAAQTSQDHPVCLYMTDTGPFNNLVKGRLQGAETPWIAMEGPWWGVGVMFPVEHLDEMTSWYERSDVTNYDRRISTWYRQQGVDCWYTMPCLVDHRTVENPSLIGRSSRTRSAVNFVGEDFSATRVDFSRPPKQMWFGPVQVPSTFTSPYPNLVTRIDGDGKKIRFRNGRFVARTVEEAEWLARAPLPVTMKGRR